MFPVAQHPGYLAEPFNAHQRRSHRVCAGFTLPAAIEPAVLDHKDAPLADLPAIAITALGIFYTEDQA